MAAPPGLIAVDLDGTLLTPERRPHPASAAALVRAQEAGFVVCLASGRAIGTIRPVARLIGLDGPIVSCNGAYVVDADGAIVHSVGLPPSTYERLLAYAEAGGVHTNVYCRDEIFFSGDGPWAKLYRQRIPGVEASVVGYEGLRSLKPTKALLIDTAEGVARHRRDLRVTFAAAEAHITVSEVEYIEVLPPGTHKGVGVERVAAHLGVPQSRVAAIGDHHNDLEMLAWAGVSAAMATAPAEVRATASMTVAASTEGGVAEFVAHIMGESSRL